MPGGRAVVSNTSPLLNQVLIERLDLLEAQFESIVVPEHVWEELLAGDEGLAAVRDLRSRAFLDVETELDRLRNAGFPISDDLYSEILERGRTDG